MKHGSSSFIVLGEANRYWQPRIESQKPVEHSLLPPQVMALPPPQLPPLLQTVFSVQTLPSSHGVPLGAIRLEQIPVVGLQVPATRHVPWDVHTTAVPPVQIPD